MLKNRTVARRLGAVALSLLLTTSGVAQAELFQFSYIFAGSDGSQTYAPGTELLGIFEGTVDPNDPNRVFINSFGSVSYIIPGVQRHDFPSIETSEFTNIRSVGSAPYVTFTGLDLSVSVCPSGFTLDNYPTDGILDDCPFASEGGFLLESALFGAFAFHSVADGTGEGSVCTDPAANRPNNQGETVNNTWGCRVSDFSGPFSNPPGSSWTLTAIVAEVDPSADIDPTVTIGDNTTLSENVVIEEDVVLEEDVSVDDDTSIGAGTTVGSETSLDSSVSIGESVVIGSGVIIDSSAIIEDNVTIGDGSKIEAGAYVCGGITIGEKAEIGENQLVTEDVPATAELPSLEVSPEPICPSP